MNVFSLAFIGDVESRYPDLPWASLAVDALAPDEAAAARRFWSANAFAEHASSIAMADVVAALGRAQVDPALWRRACAFPADELTHAELCAGVARRCGGAIHVPFDARALAQPAHAELLPLERATALVARVFVLGEAVSLRVLAGNLRAATQPLARAVLLRIVRDEAAHARFGRDYFAWVGPRLTAGERTRIGAQLAAELAHVPEPVDGAPDSGLGWMPAARWKTTVVRALDALDRRFARYGIHSRSTSTSSPTSVTR